MLELPIWATGARVCASCPWDPCEARRQWTLEQCRNKHPNCYARRHMYPLLPRCREKARFGSTLLLVATLLGCDAQPPHPPRQRLALFDFEQEGWTAKAQRTDSNPHGGLWSGVLDVGTNSGNAFSPLVACEPGDRLSIEWHARFTLRGTERVSLLIHGYDKRGVEHAAIPDLPAKLGTRFLYGSKEVLPGWQVRAVKVDLDLLHEDIQWVRLEWRVTLPVTMRRKQRAARVFFDDISITRVMRS